VARFRCPKEPHTTIELESCSVRNVLTLNARINRLTKIIWGRLGDKRGRRYFLTAAQGWKAYAQNECTSRSRSWIDPAMPHSYVGGTRAPVLFGICAVQLRLARLAELRKTAAILGEH